MQASDYCGTIGCACEQASGLGDLGAPRKRSQVQVRRLQNVKASPHRAFRPGALAVTPFRRSSASQPAAEPASINAPAPRALSEKRAQRQKRRGAGISGRVLTGENRRKLRFSPINKDAAQREGLTVKETQSGYSYPEIPQKVEEGIPNYYADSRKQRMLADMPADAGNTARSFGRFLFQSLPDDPDRGNTVEATIANVLDYATNAASRANDAQNAEFLAKVSKRWRKVIGKKAAAIDPDAPIEETAGLGGFLPGGAQSTKITMIAFAVAGAYGYQAGPKAGQAQRALGYGVSAATIALLLGRWLNPDTD